MAHLDYRGTKSTTFKLVLFAFLTATLMLLLGKITGSDWTSSAMGLISAFAVKEAVVSGAEAYRDKPK